MIEITYYRKHSRVTIQGHAGTAPEGHDLVCAGVSAIAYTLAANVEHLARIGKGRNPVVRLDAGDGEISLTPIHGAKMMVETILRAVCAGFELLAKQYPEAVHYEIHG